MPEYLNESNGRRIGAPSDSALERQLVRKGWKLVEEPETPVEEPEVEEVDDLKGLKRGELDDLAEGLGVEDVADIPNAGAVADAIREAREEADNG